VDASFADSSKPGGGFDRFAREGFALLGLEVDEVELTIMGAVDRIYRPHLEALMAAELEGIEPESDLDLTRPPS
jgi:hypothetical protein